MIWFACSNCGKPEKRPEGSAGTLVFCVCGHGNRVPWESTIPAPEEPEEPAPPPRPRRRAWSEPLPPRDPAWCLNHEDIASEHACADCREHFCARCVVILGNRTLCGPCKNYRLSRANRPAGFSGLAVTALILGLVTGPFTFCLTFIALPAREENPILSAVVGAVGVLAALLAVVLGLAGVRETEQRQRRSGHTLALIGMAMAVMSLAWSAVLVLLAVGQSWLS